MATHYMPTLQDNRHRWAAYGWSQGGEEWSGAWGGSDNLWYGSLLPRIRRFLPAGSILEIAPGYGRITHYLRHHAERLTIVDVTEKCIEHCKVRFADDEHIAYHVNDGLSLAMVPDRSIDFAFSFDSLVHTEADVVRGYVTQLADKLTDDGAAFLHHSNLGEYRWLNRFAKRIPGRLRRPLIRQGLIVNTLSARGESVTADEVRGYCEAAGLHCVSQEVINWAGRHLIDCMTVFCRPGSRHATAFRQVRNPFFMAEAHRIRGLSQLYSDAFTG